jgi:hypothetical protein
MDMSYTSFIALFIIIVWWINSQYEQKKIDRWQEAYKEGYKEGLKELQKETKDNGKT